MTGQVGRGADQIRNSEFGIRNCIAGSRCVRETGGERGSAPLKAVAWVLLGAVFLGAVHDYLSLGVSPVDDGMGIERPVSAGDNVGDEVELWTCGMHPEVIQEDPGICPICHMDLVPLKQDAEHIAGRDDSHGLWTCPMHPNILEEEPGSCPICGMDLVPVKDETGHEDRAGGGEGEILFYRSPMDPNVTSPVPRKDEMGMDYVPVYADEAETAAAQGAVVTIAAAGH